MIFRPFLCWYYNIIWNFQINLFSENEQGEPEHIILVEGGLVTINSKFVWKGDLKKLSEIEIQFKAKFVEN